MADILDLHGTAMAEFDRRVRRVRVDQWGLPTPCDQWDVHELVNHLVVEQLWAPHLLGGGTIEEAAGRYEGDVLGEEPAATWAVAAREARAAWLGLSSLDTVVHLSFGDVPARTYLWQSTFDLTVHAWDLGYALGDERIDPELVAPVLAWTQEQDFTGSPLFDFPQPAPPDADAQTRLLALTGRTAQEPPD